MVAAATTSLPERSEAGRNYDYRYVWIRDQCYAGQAAAVAGSIDLLDAAVAFVGDRLRADGARMVPAYTTRGDAVPGQRARTSPPGYPGADLLTGNWVNRQFQLDAFGEALLLLAAAAAQDRLDLDGWQAVEAAGHRDRGPLDRTGRRHLGTRQPPVDPFPAHLRRRAADHRRARPARPGRPLEQPRRRGPRRHRAHPVCTRTATGNARSTTPGSTRRCSSRPSAARSPSTTPERVATRHAVLDQLQDELYVYRFRHDQRPLADAEGAFTLCGFIAALDAHHAGHPVTAARLFERNRASCGPAGTVHRGV